MYELRSLGPVGMESSVRPKDLVPSGVRFAPVIECFRLVGVGLPCKIVSFERSDVSWNAWAVCAVSFWGGGPSKAGIVTSGPSKWIYAAGSTKGPESTSHSEVDSVE